MVEHFDVIVARVEVDTPLPSVAVIVLKGEHDLASVPQVREAIGSQLEAGRNVVVDVTETLFVDLAIVKTLMDAREEAQGLGRRVVIEFGTTPVVRRLLELTALLDQFPHEDSRDKAIREAAEQEGDA
jgi:anti-anti-sigma factor